MNQQDIIAFFDRLAPQWDADTVRSDAVISTILDGAGVCPGKAVLDVACGTGVLFPDYLARKVSRVTAIDLSPEMAKIAAGKFPEAPIRVLCGDVLTAEFGQKFDCIMVYNAFPHFPDPQALIARLSSLLLPDGTLTVAHGMSRTAIDHHHKGTASQVSLGLIHEDILAEWMSRHLQISIKISNEKMYQVTGIKK